LSFSSSVLLLVTVTVEVIALLVVDSGVAETADAAGVIDSVNDSAEAVLDDLEVDLSLFLLAVEELQLFI
jgi:hypothetical protein